jgi:hypothetical protein
MKAWLFLNRVAFICNICFVLAIIQRAYNFMPNEQIASTVVILGYTGALLCNAICLGAFVFWKVFFNKNKKTVPDWLLAFNFIAFVVQLTYFL